MSLTANTVSLYQGDCLEVLKTLEAGSIDCVITDPPYGIALENHDAGGARRKEAYRIAGDGCTKVALQVLDWAESKDLPIVAFSSPWKPWPGKWRNLIVWDKGGAVGGGGDIQTCLKRTWELIQVARNGRMNGSRDGSVWRFPVVPQHTREHIAAKPVELMRELILRFTQPNATILDPFMGSGSTGVAAVQTGRNFIGVELDEGYYRIAEKRIADAQAQPALLEIAS